MSKVLCPAAIFATLMALAVLIKQLSITTVPVQVLALTLLLVVPAVRNAILPRIIVIAGPVPIVRHSLLLKGAVLGNPGGGLIAK